MSKKGRKGTAATGASGAARGEMRAEYDPESIRRGERGKYATGRSEAANLVVLDPDLAAAFPDSASVNAALRALLEIARRDVKGRAPAA